MEKRIDTAVILAAGKGTRLRPYTHDIPKGFMRVGDESLVERSVRILKENGINNVIIGTGYLSEHYEKLALENGLQTFKNPEYSNTGSFHTLSCGQNIIKKDFLLLESDLLYHSDAIAKLIESDANDVILCSGFTQSNDEVYVETKNGNLSNLSKNTEELNSIDAELVGIWKISQSLFSELMAHHESADDASIKDYETAIAAVSKDHAISSLKIADLVWCEIDNQEHLERAREKILPRLD